MGPGRAVPKPSAVARLESRLLVRRARVAANERRSGRKRRNYGGSPFAVFKRAVLQRDRYTCLLCGDRAVTAHHLKTVGSGGKNRSENGAAVCAPCHARVHDRVIPRQRLYAALTERYGYDYPERGDG